MEDKRTFLKAGALALLAGPVASTTAVSRPQAKDAAYFSNAVLHTHEGQKVRFYDDVLKGKCVVISMMYTTCSGICPANTANMREVQAALGDRVGRDIFMYSLSLRPEFDTPEMLHEYVKRYKIAAGWTFLTGKKNDMEVIRRRLGFFDSDPIADANITNHTGVARIGRVPADRWCMVPALASTSQIVKAIVDI